MTEYNPDKIPCKVDDQAHEWMNSKGGLICCECGIPKELRVNTETKTTEEVIAMICETLAEWSGEDIAKLANDIVSSYPFHITYSGDSLFEMFKPESKKQKT